MALLKLKLPKELRSNHYLEYFFYKYFPKLERIKLTKFVTTHSLAAALKLDVDEVRDFIVQSPTIHALEHNKIIYIHPTIPMKRLIQRMRRLLSKELNES